MKFQVTCTLAGIGLAAIVAAAPSAKSPQSGSVYPIDFSGGKNAKVAGRLFNIDGKVGYFAGM